MLRHQLCFQLLFVCFWLLLPEWFLEKTSYQKGACTLSLPLVSQPILTNFLLLYKVLCTNMQILCWCPRVILPWGTCQSGWPNLSPRAMITSNPGLLPGTMSVSVILTQPESMMSVVHNATKGHTDTWGLGSILWPSLLVTKHCIATEAMVSFGPGLLLKTMSGSVTL